MNKKLGLIGAGVAVSSMLLISSAYAGIGADPGYEAYKSAFKNTMAIQNVTRNVSVSVEDNGSSLLNVNSTIKTNGEDAIGSANVAVNNGSTEQTIQFYNQDGQQIVKTSGSDVYQIVDIENSDFEDKHWKHDKQADPALAQEMETILDSLVGNLKNYVSVEDEVGGVRDIHFKVSGSQISPVVNTIGSVIIKHGSQANPSLPAPAETLGVNLSSIQDSFPKLAQDIKIESVSMNATVDADNHITNQIAEIEISGNDGQGTTHKVIVKLQMGLSDFNSTVADTVDLEGKQIEKINPFENLKDRHGDSK
ncbi:hypothetical protein [Paenibacillus eucommiae]|uniref:Uncharacterized protein n=1 Tax=Paenibacillus eucommiae TaxID=1355755 RepID=A0ABS4IZX1_9BACL|nr:hypothetical protein [Paenibacillus eucommiae]MBP1992396.1 hypothetical protein [Paenibacillus eucommiae]